MKIEYERFQAGAYYVKIDGVRQGVVTGGNGRWSYEVGRERAEHGFPTMKAAGAACVTARQRMADGAKANARG